MHRVLVVDDSVDERSVMARLLRHEGYEVFLAGDGDEALQLLHTNLPDLIVLDIAMPGLGGLEVLEILQAKPRWKRVPVVMLTGMSDTLTIQRAGQLGAKEFMVKATFSVSQLLETIRRYATQIGPSCDSARAAA